MLRWEHEIRAQISNREAKGNIANLELADYLFKCIPTSILKNWFPLSVYVLFSEYIPGLQSKVKRYIKSNVQHTQQIKKQLQLNLGIWLKKYYIRWTYDTTTITRSKSRELNILAETNSCCSNNTNTIFIQHSSINYVGCTQWNYLSWRENSFLSNLISIILTSSQTKLIRSLDNKDDWWQREPQDLVLFRIIEKLNYSLISILRRASRGPDSMETKSPLFD